MMFNKFDCHIDNPKRLPHQKIPKTNIPKLKVTSFSELTFSVDNLVRV